MLDARAGTGYDPRFPPSFPENASRMLMPLSSGDVARLVQETWIRRVEQHAELASTNDRALEMADSVHEGDLPLLVFSERQTRGRGRAARAWWSAPGALTFSLLVPLDQERLPMSQRSRLALACGVAVARSIQESVPTAPVRLKWPNDVYLLDRKVGGILVEVPNGSMPRGVLGLGVNVNNRSSSAPAELGQHAVSLCEVTGAELDRLAFLVTLLRHLEEQFVGLCEQASTVLDQWRRFCLLTGRQVRWNAAGRCLEGICEGIDQEGRLLLRTAHGVRRLVTGSIRAFDS